MDLIGLVTRRVRLAGQFIDSRFGLRYLESEKPETFFLKNDIIIRHYFKIKLKTSYMYILLLLKIYKIIILTR